MPDSPFRLDRLRRTDRRSSATPSLDIFREVLADHADYPSGVCCHPDDALGRLDQGATVASILMDLDTKTMWIADGHAVLIPYRALDYASFLSKPSLVAER